jgi:hypothetical protein
VNRNATLQSGVIPAIDRWASLALSVHAIALVVAVPRSLTRGVRQAVGWEIESHLALGGGALLMVVGATVAILMTISAWRGTARPSVPVVGASLGWILLVVGVALVTRTVRLFPGPIPVSFP